MENAIDHNKKERLDKAASMDRVPLIPLHNLVKERREYALRGNAEEVEAVNKMIRDLLGL